MEEELKVNRRCFALKMRVKLCALTLESLSLSSVESLGSLPGVTEMPTL